MQRSLSDKYLLMPDDRDEDRVASANQGEHVLWDTQSESARALKQPIKASAMPRTTLSMLLQISTAHSITIGILTKK